MPVDPYYIELALDSLHNSIKELRHAQQYLFRAKDADTAERLSKIISSIRNRSDALLFWLPTDPE
jgi:hypothetical protein